MRMNREGLQNREGWDAIGVKLPAYDVAAMALHTAKDPVWVHFGAGNIFRGFIAALQHRLLDQGLADRGIVVAETYDGEILSRVYEPCDNLCMNVTLHADGAMDREIIASVAEAVAADAGDPEALARLGEVFAAPGLQLASFTITEKGYALRGADGELLPQIAADMRSGPAGCGHVMGIAAALLYRRYRAGAYPLAMVSLDNCSHNGEKLGAALLEIARAWVSGGLVDAGFADYVADERAVSFPWSMIDKITPRPAPAVEAQLTAAGIAGMAPVETAKHTFIAPYVNAERPEYLVVEDRFPNGRPALDKVGVYLTDRETVNRVERMKVTTCLNPLHTAMSVYGCLLGFAWISDEMQDADLAALVQRLGYNEGLPVATDPGILSPRAFLAEVLEERLPNPFLRDAPQRIVTDTSQKVAIRFGETIKSYLAEGRDLGELVAIPLAIAGWLRYLLGVDDNGEAMALSPDPMREQLQGLLSGIGWDRPESYAGQLLPILSNAAVFGLDLTATELAGRIEALFVEQLAGAGAVRATLHKHLSGQ